MISKEEVLKYCTTVVDQRIAEVEFAIKDADDALANDTKSSAGDKYETSREMVQQDINRYQKQLTLAQNDLSTLQKIDSLKQNERIGLGSLVQTNMGLYFISISIGLLKIDGESIYAISPVSPLGQILMGKSAGETITFNNKEQELLSVN